jgi:predicted RNase H-like nuclease (RuvC/YqgF family)
MRIIGIDPGKNNTGISILEQRGDSPLVLKTQKMKILDSIFFLVDEVKANVIDVIAVEDPKTNTGHVIEKGVRKYAAHKLKGAGYVLAYFGIFEEFAKKNKIDFIPVSIFTTHNRGQILRVNNFFGTDKKTDHEREAAICALHAFDLKKNQK